MPLESPVSYIQDLDVGNPLDSDFVRDGAAHVRALKVVLSNFGKQLPSLSSEQLSILSNSVTPTTCLFSVIPTSTAASATLNAINGAGLAPRAIVIVTVGNKTTPVTIAGNSNVNGIILNGTSPLVMDNDGACMVLQKTLTGRWQELFRIQGVPGTASTKNTGTTSGTLMVFEDLEGRYRKLTDNNFVDTLVINDAASVEPAGTFRFKSTSNKLVLDQNRSLDGGFTSTSTVVTYSAGDVNFNVPIKYQSSPLLYQKSIVLTNTYLGEANHTFSHGLGKVLVPWGIYFKCLTAEHGALVGDIVPYWGFGSVGPAVSSSLNDVKVRAVNGAGCYNRTTNNYSIISANKWSINLVCGEE